MAKVKKLTKFFGVVGDNEEVLNEFKSYYQEFDKNDNVIKEVEYHHSGEIESASGFKYDEKNRLIEEIHYFDEDEVGEIIKFTLDDQGRPTEIETTYADGSKSLKKVHRTEHLLSVKTFDEDNTLEGEEVVKFNSKGKAIEEIHYDEDHEIFQRSVYEYDDNDLLVKRINYGNKDEFLVETLFGYDEKGKLVKQVQFSEKGKVISSTVLEYDDQGNEIFQQNNAYEMRAAYDPKGRLISEETVRRGSNMVESFNEYIYNENGLKTEDRSFEMGESYQLEPGVMTRTGSSFTRTRYEYEFFED